MAPWQLLLKKSNKFIWDEVHERVLDKVKEIITNPAGPILRHFDTNLPICLLTDASRSGIGDTSKSEHRKKKDRRKGEDMGVQVGGLGPPAPHGMA